MLIVVVVVSVVVVSVVVVIVRDLVSSNNNPFRRARLTNSTQSTQMKIESKVIYHYDVSSLVNHDKDETNYISSLLQFHMHSSDILGS